MTGTLTVPIYQNMTADGGPLWDFKADPNDTEAGSNIVRGASGEVDARSTDIHLDTLQEWLTDEMESHEPVHLSIGDAPLYSEDGDEYLVGTVELPLVDGYIVTIHRLPGQGVDKTANLSMLQNDESRRRSFERQLKRHGGEIEG
jgi:hypothetical protein